MLVSRITFSNEWQASSSPAPSPSPPRSYRPSPGGARGFWSLPPRGLLRCERS
ncbi:hypothetical protein BHE74_00052899, partial [Ensete ventricosum]